MATRGKVVKETVTEFPPPTANPLEQPEGFDQDGEQQLPPEVEQHYQLLQTLKQSTTLRIPIFKLRPDGTSGQVGSISANECNPAAPHDAVRRRFGAGHFQAHFEDPDNPGKTIVADIDVEPTPEDLKRDPGVVFSQPPNITVPQISTGNPQQDSMINLLLGFQAQQTQASERYMKMLVEVVRDKGPGEKKDDTLEQFQKFILLQKALKDETNGPPKIKFWLDFARDFVEQAREFIAPAAASSPGMVLVSQILPAAKQTLEKLGDAFSAKWRAEAQTATAPIHPRLLGKEDPLAQQAMRDQEQAAANYAAGISEEAQQLRAMVQHMYLPRWLKIAEKEGSPYDMAQIIHAQLGQEAPRFLEKLALSSKADFYKVFPQCLDQQDWFDDFIDYILNPDLPDADMEGEDLEPPAPVVVSGGTISGGNGQDHGPTVTPQPKTKKTPVKETEAEDKQ